MRGLLVWTTAAAALAGCGLVDPNIADFQIRLPAKEVAVDAQNFQLADEPVMPELTCGGELEGVCDAGAEDLCGGEGTCLGTCEGGRCLLVIPVALWNDFHLEEEVPELERVDQPVARISVDRAYYAVMENTFNQTSPELEVYLAPRTVMSPGDPQAEQIGTIAPVAPGETFTDRDLDLAGEGDAILRRYLRDYAVPFNLIVATTIELEPGDPMPMGKIVAIVQVDASVGLR